MNRRILIVCLSVAVAGAGCVTTIAESTDCDRWVSQYKQALAESQPVHQVLQIHHRLKRYVHRQIAQVKPKPKLVAVASPVARPRRLRQDPSELMKHFSLLCGDLPKENQVALLEPGPLPGILLDRPVTPSGPIFEAPPSIPGAPVSGILTPSTPGSPIGGVPPIGGFPPGGAPGSPVGAPPSPPVPPTTPLQPPSGPSAPVSPVSPPVAPGTPVTPVTPTTPPQPPAAPTSPGPAPTSPVVPPSGPEQPPTLPSVPTAPNLPPPTAGQPPPPVKPSAPPVDVPPETPVPPPAAPETPPVPSPVPEPSSLVLLFTGGLGILGLVRRRT